MSAVIGGASAVEATGRRRRWSRGMARSDRTMRAKLSSSFMLQCQPRFAAAPRRFGDPRCKNGLTVVRR
ncbi:MAG: hypothetical protein JNK05_39540 [Myxococcales bacterium]|nr:hypothetical protein [Myxococcales bacterium]